MHQLWPLILALALASPAQAGPPDSPRYTAAGNLLRPGEYRQWVWLSSGLGMSYGPMAQAMANQSPPFDNVFVNRSAYRAFLRTGAWPDKTVFVLEVRASLSKGSINNGGHFQGKLRGIEVEVKDEARFPGKWAFFAFPSAAAEGALLPPSAACYSCHAQNGAVDNTFVQFYPTLTPVAKQKGTFKQAE